MAIGTVLIAAAIAAACDKVPLLAPRESTISVTSQAVTLPPGGSTTIRAMVMESSGTAVHDGTLVRFTATLGRVEPADAETRGGVATTTFIAGSLSGTAEIRAASGAATGTGGDGNDNAGSGGNSVRIAIGGAAAAAVTVTANPSRLGPSGGTVTIVAVAVDGSGNRLTGVPIAFSTTAGSLSSTSALSDGTGEARVTLTTRTNATVTARVGENSGDVAVTVANAATVTLALTPEIPVVGVPVSLQVTPSDGTIPRVVVNWGDGTTDDLGVVAAARTAPHVYGAPGVYTITATSSADGETFSTSISASVRPVTVAIGVGGGMVPNRCAPVTFTATVSPAGAQVVEYRWRVDSDAAVDEYSATTGSNELVRIFRAVGPKRISVTVVTLDGRTTNGQTDVVVQEPSPPATCS